MKQGYDIRVHMEALKRKIIDYK